MMVTVDYSTLELTGNGHAQDSLSLALQAAARLLRMDADYEMIYCLLSNAFSPAIDTGEDCTAWWHVQGWLGHGAMDTACACIGVDARPLPVCEFEGDWKSEEDRTRHLQGVARTVQDGLAGGEVILVSGGWRARQNDRFVPWCWAGVITEVRPDGAILGACLNGMRDNALDNVPRGEAWLLSACEQTATQEEADTAMLRQATARIRGERQFARTERSVYGLGAMDVWIEKMEQVPFCQPCFESAPDRVWTCAHNNGDTAMNGARTAASYLRRRASTFPETAGPGVEAAAGHYERIAQLLRPAVTGEGGEHYREFIGDAGRQRDYAEGVLGPVREGLIMAAGEMEGAVAAAGR